MTTVSARRTAAHLPDMTATLSPIEHASAQFATSLLPIEVSPDASDESLRFLADAAIEYAAICDAEYAAEPGAHAEDMESPLHGGDYDPCSICNPYDHDLAVASLLDMLRNDRETAEA